MTRPQWVGGQAVLEGVMMRHHDRMVVFAGAVTTASALLRKKSAPFEALPSPGLADLERRGLLFESLILGVHAINLSAAEVLQEEGEEMQGWQTFLVVFLGLALGWGFSLSYPPGWQASCRSACNRCF